MKAVRFFVFVAAMTLLSPLSVPVQYAAPPETHLMRFPDIWHDQVVFVYAEDLWVASTKGGPARRLMDVLGDLLRDGTLLLDRGRNRRGNAGQLLDRVGDFLDGANRFLGRLLDAGDLLADFSGGLRGLFGQRLDLGSDHRETASRLAGAGGLDRCVQRQQIGLARDGIDEFDHVADARRSLG